MANERRPVAGYIRMSSPKQESSPAQQRQEIVALAQRKGCDIVAWYADEGISGDEIEKRPNFCRMLEDAKAGKFRAILCWDQDRFGRFDSLKAGYVVEPLRQAGVRLITVTQGEIDWTDFAGRMMYAIQQEGKNQFLISLSQTSLRGRMQSAREGHGVSRAPMGYDRVFFDPSGKLVHRVVGDERFSKPREWKARLDVSTNARAVEAVRFMFDRYADTDANLRSIAHELNQQGLRTFRGRLWEGPSVKVVLRNPAYLGRMVVGKFPRGRFNHIGNGTIGGDGPITTDNAHPALIDEALFRKVQAKILRRAMKERTRSNGYLLSSLLLCGHDGKRMHGHVANRGSGLRYYVAHVGDGDPAGPRRHYRVQKEPLERWVVDQMVELLNAPEAAGRLRKAVADRLRAKPKADETVRRLRLQMDALDRKIAKGAERLLLVDFDSLTDASAALAAWRAERRKLAQELEGSDAVDAGSPADEAARVLDQLERLREDFGSTDPDKLRAALKALIADIRLFFEPGGARKWRFKRGVIRFGDASLVALTHPIPTSRRCSTAS